MEWRQSAWGRSVVKSATSWHHLFSELRCQHRAHGEQRRSRGAEGRVRLQWVNIFVYRNWSSFPHPQTVYTPRSLSFRGKEIHQRDSPLFLSHPLLFCSVSNKFRFLPFLLTRQILLPLVLPAPLPHSRVFWWHMGAISLLSLPFLIHLPTQSTKPLCAPPTISWITGNSPHSASMTFPEFHGADSSRR